MNSFLWAVLAALIWGIVPAFEKLGLSKTQPLVGLFFRSIGVLIGILFLKLFFLKPGQLKILEPKAVFFLILSGFLASFLAQICFYNALKTGTVSKVVPVSGAYPLIAFIIGVFLLGEAVTPAKVCGVLLVVAGIWALNF